MTTEATTADVPYRVGNGGPGALAAKALGVSIKEQVFEPRSIYGAEGRGVAVYQLDDGREMGVVFTKTRLRAAIADTDWPGDPYDSEDGQIAIANAFGLSWHPEGDDF